MVTWLYHDSRFIIVRNDGIVGIVMGAANRKTKTNIQTKLSLNLNIYRNSQATDTNTSTLMTLKKDRT